jgi:hypothetical protein
LWKVERYEFGETSYGKTYIPKSMKIRSAVLELYAHRRYQDNDVISGNVIVEDHGLSRKYRASLLCPVGIAGCWKLRSTNMV